MENENQMMGNEVAESVEDVTTEKKTEAQGEEQAAQKAPEKKYTDEEVDKIIARKIAAERKRMSKLFADEQQVTEIEQRERNVLLRELKADAKDALIDRGLPSALSGLLNYDSKEEMAQSLNEIETIFNEALQQGLKDKLRGHAPTRGSGGGLKEAYRERALHDAFAPKEL